MMKVIIINAIQTVGKIFGFFYSRKLSLCVKMCVDLFYTGFIKKRFFRIGKNSVVSYRCHFVGESRISIGDSSEICPDNCITAWKGSIYDQGQTIIEIGDNVQMGASCHITGINHICVGNGCLLGKRVTITDNSHGDTSIESVSKKPAARRLFSKGEVIIGENVWIGDKVTILPNVHIGNKSIIGANSVVSSDIPSNSIYVNFGNKIIKQI